MMKTNESMAPAELDKANPLAVAMDFKLVLVVQAILLAVVVNGTWEGVSHMHSPYEGMGLVAYLAVLGSYAFSVFAGVLLAVFRKRPVLLVAQLAIPGGLFLASILLMVAGTFWSA